MKNIKYLLLSVVLIGFTACNEIEDVDRAEDLIILPELTSGDVDFSNYVALGASFTAGFTDGGLFIAGQEHSFPNTIAKEFANGGGGTFTQPLMSDNSGGILVGGNVVRGYRLTFNRDIPGPQPLDQFLTGLGAPVPPITTEAGINIGSDFNNFGIPGAKSWHLVAPGYAAANPYYARIASGPAATVLEDAMAKNPSFFTISEVGGNDVLGYALTGGDGSDPITPTAQFDGALNAIVGGLTAGGAKGAIGNVPYITSLSHFTTVTHAELDPSDPAFGPRIPTLNGIFGQINQVYAFLGVPERSIVFSETEVSAMVIKDESLADISAQITGVLNASPTFPLFVQSLGLPVQAAPLVANLLGVTYGQSRQATAADLLTLSSASVIGTVNAASFAFLTGQGIPAALAGQFSVEGITYPLDDTWVLLPSEQAEITAATDAYNATIASVASSSGLALVDLNSILAQASTTGIQFDDYNMNTSLVFGGLVSLDGVHLTGRGSALMANSFLDAIDATYGSNFRASGNVAKAGDFPTNYSPELQ